MSDLLMLAVLANCAGSLRISSRSVWCRIWGQALHIN